MAGKVFKERCGHVVGVLSLLTSLGFVSARSEQARMTRLKGAEGTSTGGTSTGGGATEGGQGGAGEVLVPNPRDDDNNSKSKLTLSVATVCGLSGDGADEGDSDPPEPAHTIISTLPPFACHT